MKRLENVGIKRSYQTIHSHIKKLEKIGIVTSSKKGYGICKSFAWILFPELDDGENMAMTSILSNPFFRTIMTPELLIVTGDLKDVFETAEEAKRLKMDVSGFFLKILFTLYDNFKKITDESDAEAMRTIATDELGGIFTLTRMKMFDEKMSEELLSKKEEMNPEDLQDMASDFKKKMFEKKVVLERVRKKYKI